MIRSVACRAVEQATDPYHRQAERQLQKEKAKSTLQQSLGAG